MRGQVRTRLLAAAALTLAPATALAQPGGGLSFLGDTLRPSIAATPGTGTTGTTPTGAAASASGSGTTAARSASASTTPAAPAPTLRPAAPVVPATPVVAQNPPAPQATGAERVNRDEAAERDAAFGQLGIRAGSFVLLPAISGTVEYTDDSAASTPELLSRLLAELTIRTDTEGYGIEARIAGTMQTPLDGGGDPVPALDTALTGYVDLPGAMRGTLDLGFRIGPEGTASAELSDTASVAPTVQGLSVAFTIERNAGLIGLALRGAIERTAYGGATPVGLGRSNTLYAATLRASLDSGAILQPFAELTGYRRIYDETLDASGNRRSAWGGEALLGVAIDAGRGLTGRLAAGYTLEAPDDADLPDVEGLVLRGHLALAVDALTEITFAAATGIEPSALAGSAGSVTYDADLDVTHDLLRNLSLSGGLGLRGQVYSGPGTDVWRAEARAGLAWQISRYAALELAAAYSRTFVGGEEDEFRASIGVTLRD